MKEFAIASLALKCRTAQGQDLGAGDIRKKSSAQSLAREERPSLADLAGAEQIEAVHLAEALQYRMVE